MITTAASPSPSAFSATSVTCMTTLTSTLMEITTMEMKRTKWKARHGNPRGRRTVIIEQPSSAFCFPWAFWYTSSLGLYEWDLKPSLALVPKMSVNTSRDKKHRSPREGATWADKDIKTVYHGRPPAHMSTRTEWHAPMSHSEISQGPLQSQAAFPSTHDDHPM